MRKLEKTWIGITIMAMLCLIIGAAIVLFPQDLSASEESQQEEEVAWDFAEYVDLLRRGMNPRENPDDESRRKEEMAEMRRYFWPWIIEQADDLVTRTYRRSFEPEMPSEKPFQFAGIGTDVNLNWNREVVRNPNAGGKPWLVRDYFRVYFQTGPEFSIPIYAMISVNPMAKGTLVWEYIVVRGADSYEEGLKDDYLRKYTSVAPWEMLPWGKLEHVFAQPVGTGIVSNLYLDIVGGAGLSFGFDVPIQNVAGAHIGPRIDVHRYRLGSRMIYRESEDVVKVIREREKGWAVDTDFLLEAKVNWWILKLKLRSEFFDGMNGVGDYDREVYEFRRSHLADPSTDDTFSVALERPDARKLKKNGVTADGHIAYRAHSDSRYQKQKLSFLLLNFGGTYRGSERISYDDAQDDSRDNHYFHAFTVRGNGKRSRSADVQFDLAKVAGEYDDALVVTRLEYDFSNVKAKKFKKVIDGFNLIAGEELISCDLTGKKKLGRKRAELLLIFNKTGIDRIISVPLESREAMELGGIKSLQRQVETSRSTKDLEKWARHLVHFVKRNGKHPESLATLARMAGRDGVYIETRVGHSHRKTRSGYDPICDGAASLGAREPLTLLDELNENALYMIDPIPLEEPKLIRMNHIPRSSLKNGT